MHTTARHPLPIRPLFAALLLTGFTWSSQAQVAYVSSEKDHKLTIVDLKTQAVTGTVATCKRPRHMVITPDGKQLMVACGDSGQADVIDLATRKSVKKIGLGDDPEIFDLTPDGKTLYVSNEEDGALGVVDLATGKRTGEIKVGEEPEGVLVSRDGKTVYVTSEVASLVHVIDTATGKVTKNIKAGKRPRRFAMTPDGSQLWVTNELGASVTVISTADHSVLDTIKFEVKGARAADITPVGITMSADGKRAFVGLGKANHVAFVDVASRKTTDLVLSGKRAWGLALNKAQDRLYVANGLSDDMTIIDVPGAKALKSVAVGRVPHSIVVVE
ncbi:PQQ-dependent catabolism-associated beta-propeller protein [Sphaerotilus sp.]|uniref:PQQ-dependent catabolism-associated beta-propeller protein n=1 Tax=Sphaerotilus sp. TaxID=2093942 RepID=UPI002ACDD992|nr:PQQ-dependent catabolism-associated beta-propeller protein [Sphaerotilus sp.]MDZ7855163.1 PQQ-dependent catabolism-associated beta-propeller protein [Sphaerotilus sp.]